MNRRQVRSKIKAILDHPDAKMRLTDLTDFVMELQNQINLLMDELDSTEEAAYLDGYEAGQANAEVFVLEDEFDIVDEFCEL